MIIEEITVNNWRGYRDPHTFEFDDGFNLVVGRNEAGKSTLFEAMTRALIDRHNSRAEPIKRIRPLGSSLAPEVTVVFRSDGTRYKVHKRFLDDPSSELHTERDGGWELDHEGDKADEVLRSILEGDKPARTEARPEHRGLAQALWYLQDEPSLPDDAWSDAVNQGLTGLVDQVSSTEAEQVFLNRIQDAYEDTWTPEKGRVSKNSELSDLEDEIAELEDEVADVEQRREKVAGFRSDLEEFAIRRDEKEESLEEAREELETLEEALDAAEEFEAKLEGQEQAVEDLQARLEDFEDDLDGVQERTEEIDDLSNELEDLRARAQEHEAKAKQAKDNAESHRERWKEELEPELKDVEADLDQLRHLKELRSLEERQEVLQQQSERVEEIRDDLEDQRSQLEELTAPTDNERDQLNQARSELRLVEAKEDSTAIRVGFDIETDVDIVAEPEPATDPEEGEHLVTQPTVFTIGDIGEVSVRGGGESIEELAERRQELEETIDELLDRYDVDDPQAFSGLVERRIQLEDRIEDLKGRLEERTGDEDPMDQLETVRREIQATKEGIDDIPNAWEDLEAGEIDDKFDDLRNRKERLIDEIEDEQKMEQETQQRHLELVEEGESLHQQVTQTESRIDRLREEKAEILDNYGTRDNLEEQVDKVQGSLQDEQETLEDLQDQVQEMVEEPRQRHEQAENRVARLEEDIQEIDKKIQDRQVRIEEAAGEGLYSKSADLEASLNAKRRRLEVVRRRAEGSKLLHDIVDAYKREQAEALARPLQKIVEPWLELLTDDAYEELQLDEALMPEAVKSTRYDTSLPLSELSHGTQEQVIVLLRLGIGVLLSEEERQLVVVDDRLVNADAIRMKRLRIILEEVAANHCQVIVATCNDTPYAGIEGEVIRVPDEGRQ